MNHHEPPTPLARGSATRTLLKRSAISIFAMGFVGVLAAACLDRPVAPQQPSSADLKTALYKSQKVDKIDLLFMIDNSASMADKQVTLADAVPDLVSRLTNPVCVNRETRQPLPAAQQPGSPTDECPEPLTNEREFDPIVDIHIGVITSSIGGHGADLCSPASASSYNERQEDMSHLIDRGAAFTPGEVPTYQGQGFLNWDPTGQKSSPPGEADVATLQQNFSQMVRGAGEDGCGFEANLEAWYRFLVDPAPYQKMVLQPCFDGGPPCAFPEGVDQTVLTQRKDFLRKDSLMAVIMLTDENDCSIADGGQSFLVLQANDGTGEFHMAPGTAACADDPWSPDCKSCWEVDHAVYTECQTGWSNPSLDDALNLRCYEQKRRFGISFLHPIRRYVEGLTQPKLGQDPVTGESLFNPLFCVEFETKPDPDNPGATIPDPANCAHVARDPNLVFLGGIVGVPWQDLAYDPSTLVSGYRPADQLSWTQSNFEAAGIPAPGGVAGDTTLWNVILGETVASNAPENAYEIVPTSVPIDPLMIETVDPRTGTNPATGSALAPPSASSPTANPVNGHEWDVAQRDDLQYACIFPLPTPIDCNTAGAACDCKTPQNKPLCQDASGSYGNTQYYAKAYPGRRQLAVLKGMESQAIVASICPANLDPAQTDSVDWGYRPAIAAIVDRLKGALQGTCWDQRLAPDEIGSVDSDCIVLEATKQEEGPDGTVTCPPCVDIRCEASPAAKGALAREPEYIDSGANCVCEISEAGASCDENVPQDTNALNTCLNSDLDNPPGVTGWCYLDPFGAPPQGNPNKVASCPADAKRLIRFMGGEVPATGALTFLQCKGATLSQ